MIQNYPKTKQYSFSQLMHSILTTENINTHNIETTVLLHHKDAKKHHHKIDSQIHQLALICALRFKASINLAVISGAGIAGLCTSFELLARGYKVIIAEKRETFSRSNIINFNIEIQHFLKKFHLLKEFEESVAARIESHRILHIGKNGTKNLNTSDVSKLQLSNVPFELKKYNKLFKENGIYSVKIQDLQTFLAKKVLDAGVQIFGNVEVQYSPCSQEEPDPKVHIRGKSSFYNNMILQPQLFFVAEGAHSTTAQKLEMETTKIQNECTDEHWIYGNANYFGKKNFVVSIIDTSEEKLQIANVIFNAKVKEINIAVTSQKFLSQRLIEERILAVVKKACNFENVSKVPLSLITSVKQPVHVKNEKRKIYSKDNVFLIGDAAGNSSPLAGLGGTLSLTLIPHTVEKLLSDLENQPKSAHANFKIFSEAYISRWMKKSSAVKKLCIKTFDSDK